MTWHADVSILAAYHRAEVDETVTASVEAHLLGCGACRDVYAAHAATDRTHGAIALEAIWGDVIDRIDAPKPSLVERGLARLGVAPHTARVLAATPALQLSWLLSITIAVLTAAVLTRGSDAGPLLQLLVAPLLPPLGVALSYGPGVDPAYEFGVATPTHGLRLVLLRTTAAVAVTVGGGLATSLLLPWSWTAFAWLLPALALATLTLAMRTLVASPVSSALVVDAAWATGVLLAQDRHRPGLEAVGPATQLAFVALAAVGVLIVSARSHFVAEGGR